MHEYVISLSVDLCKAIPEVGKVVEPFQEVLDTYQDAFAAGGTGHPRLQVRSKMIDLRLTVSRVLSHKEREMAKSMTLQAFRDKFPDYDFRVDSFRRQSSKPRSQPQSR